MTPAADGSSAQPGPATRALRNATRGAWTNGSTRARRSKLIRDRRQRRQQALPRRRAIGGADRGRGRIGQRRAGAREAVVETQHPDPAAGKHMMQRGIVDRIRRRLRRRPQAIPALDAFEVRVEALRRRQPSAAAPRSRPSARCRNPRGPLASITNARGDADGPAVALALRGSCDRPRRRKPIEPRHRRGRRRPRPRASCDERVIEVRPVPVRVGDLVVRARRDQQLPLAIVVVRERVRRAGGRRT